MITEKSESVRVSSKTMSKLRRFVKKTPYTIQGYISQAIEIKLAMDKTEITLTTKTPQSL